MSNSEVVRPCYIARILRISVLLAPLLTLPACWVSSINPLYDEGTVDHPHDDPDVILDQSLIGSWAATDGKCTTLLTIASKDRGYDLQSASQGEGCEDKSHRYAQLVKLETYYFLDVEPIPDDVCDMCAAKHDILLAKFDNTTLSLTPIDSDWLKQSIEAKTVTLATVAGDTDTITASSKELKAFYRKCAENKEAFKAESAETFKRKNAS
jgi:hypothetical protein